MRALLILALACCAGPALAEKSGPVYLVTAADIDGTTYRQVAFMHERHITTLKQCERARRQGLMSGWKDYTHESMAARGYTYTLSYFCAQGDYNLSKWTGRGERYLYVYQVNVTDGLLVIQPRETYEQCQVAVREAGDEGSRTHFCARGSQVLRDASMEGN